MKESKKEIKQGESEAEEFMSPSKHTISPPASATATAEAPVPKKSDMFWKVTTAILIVILAVFIWQRGMFNSNSPSVTGNAVAGVTIGDGSGLMDDDYIRGDKNAPVTIVEFSDYQCPFCGRYYTQTYGEIKSKYIDTGKVKYVFRDFPLSFHPEAEPAAVAANCAGKQGKYYEYHDKLYSNQQSLGSANYKKWAGDIGLDVAAWETCLKDPRQKEEIQKDQQDGITAGVQGTPAFFINGKMISGAQPLSVFQQAIEAGLK